MNAAVLRAPAVGRELRLEPLTLSMLDELLAIERAAYEFPWNRANFVDSVAAGYLAQALLGTDNNGGNGGAAPAMRAYFIAMCGVEEMHLLNLTVAPRWQRRGIATALLDELVQRCSERGAKQLWLEVRGSNSAACALYQRYGFRQLGLRRGYYPAPGGQREDALVMGLKVSADGLV